MPNGTPTKSIVNSQMCQDSNGGEIVVCQNGATHRSADDIYTEMHIYLIAVCTAAAAAPLEPGFFGLQT